MTRGPHRALSRSPALDALRCFVTLLVVAHHSVLAYVRFGHLDRVHYLWSTAPIVDPARWLGFDLFVGFNDIFFMSLMFFLSGLFVRPSLGRHGAAAYLRGRAWRLGVPFVLVVLGVMPLAYYPSWLEAGGRPGFGAYWWGCLSVGPWPGGPAWFVWVLFVFDVLAVGLVRLAPGGVWTRIAGMCRRRPAGALLGFAIICVAAYLPLLWRFGAGRWLAAGPFAVQASRIGLYGAWFLAGVAIGPDELGRLPLAAQWRRWVVAGLALYAGMVVLQAAPPGARVPVVRAVLFAPTCVALVGACLAVFLHARVTVVFARLGRSAYGIYLLHYLFLVWLQYALLAAGLPAIAKAALVFAGTLALSWGATICLQAIRRRAMVA